MAVEAMTAWHLVEAVMELLMVAMAIEHPTTAVVMVMSAVTGHLIVVLVMAEGLPMAR